LIPAGLFATFDLLRKTGPFDDRQRVVSRHLDERHLVQHVQERVPSIVPTRESGDRDRSRDVRRKAQPDLPEEARHVGFERPVRDVRGNLVVLLQLRDLLVRFLEVPSDDLDVALEHLDHVIEAFVVETKSGVRKLVLSLNG
jgi:hypothetical protein